VYSGDLQASTAVPAFYDPTSTILPLFTDLYFTQIHQTPQLLTSTMALSLLPSNSIRSLTGHGGPTYFEVSWNPAHHSVNTAEIVPANTFHPGPSFAPYADTEYSSADTFGTAASQVNSRSGSSNGSAGYSKWDTPLSKEHRRTEFLGLL
jgi:hypothetical protein